MVCLLFFTLVNKISRLFPVSKLSLKLVSLSFIEKKQSVLLFGPTGVGKTMLTRHLAFSALKAGHSVLFTRANKGLIPVLWMGHQLENKTVPDNGGDEDHESIVFYKNDRIQL